MLRWRLGTAIHKQSRGLSYEDIFAIESWPVLTLHFMICHSKGAIGRTSSCYGKSEVEQKLYSVQHDFIVNLNTLLLLLLANLPTLDPRPILPLPLHLNLKRLHPILFHDTVCHSKKCHMPAPQAVTKNKNSEVVVLGCGG